MQFVKINQMHLFVIIFICLFSTCMPNDCYSRKAVARKYDYGFMAFLFSKKNDKLRCTGVIIAESWILNYCQYGEYVYDFVRVGLQIDTDKRPTGYFIYPLDKRIVHPDHAMTSFPQINDKYDLQDLYASKNALFLDHTSRPMILKVEDSVWPAVLSRNTKLPKNAFGHFFPKADEHMHSAVVKPWRTLLRIVHNSVCDKHFQQYNLAPQNRKLQYCVNSSTVSFDDCCENNAIMEKDKILIGVLAWSTACWSPREPWVFTNIGWYYKWITNITSDEELFPPTL